MADKTPTNLRAGGAAASLEGTFLMRRPILARLWHELLWWAGAIGFILTGSAILHWLRFV
jgi:hypothetical protein